VKIGDFGITKRVSNDDTPLQTTTNIPHYMAPEIRHYVDDPNLVSGVYTNAVGIWSFACVVHRMLALQVPFPDPRGIVTFCGGGAFPEKPLAQRTSQEGAKFLKFILLPFPTSRPTAKEIIEKAWVHMEGEGHTKSSTDVDPEAVEQKPPQDHCASVGARSERRYLIESSPPV
jgi:serine/threonine protein kinase